MSNNVYSRNGGATWHTGTWTGDDIKPDPALVPLEALLDPPTTL